MEKLHSLFMKQFHDLNLGFSTAASCRCSWCLGSGIQSSQAAVSLGEINYKLILLRLWRLEVQGEGSSSIISSDVPLDGLEQIPSFKVLT